MGATKAKEPTKSSVLSGSMMSAKAREERLAMTNTSSTNAAALLPLCSGHCHLSRETNWVEVSHPRAVNNYSTSLGCMREAAAAAARSAAMARSTSTCFPDRTEADLEIII